MTNYSIPPTSRYYGLELLTFGEGTEREVRYLSRRFLPRPGASGVAGVHAVAEGDRPDLVAGRAFGDPLAFWRLADANGAMRPTDLTDTPGRVLIVPAPPGVAAITAPGVMPGVPGLPG